MRTIKTWLATIATLLCSIMASAHDFEVDGIYYNITSETDLTVSATFRGLRYDDYENEYSGAIIIPSTISYNSSTYRVTSVEDYAFYGCSGLTAITLPEGVTSIGYSAFEDCSSLASINIPESVTDISHYAFSGCSSLTAITIPENVTNIGNCVFSGCYNITSIAVATGNTRYDSRNNCNAIIETNSNTLIQGCSVTVIPESVTCIWCGAFRGYRTLSSITIPEGVKTIREYAFMDCCNLTAITLPEGLINIGHYAFWNCICLSDVCIPESVTNIEENVFNGCGDLTTINIPKGVTSIADRTFYGCSSLTAVTLPEGLIDIGDGAFEGCSNLTTINIPVGVTRIRSSVFAGCSSITAIALPECINSIEGGAFYGCNSLISINIPEEVTSIESNAFRGCSSLTTINIPEKITSIEGALFAGCSQLTTINIPEAVTSIKNSAFSGCSSLTAINIPETVTSIEDGAFYDCNCLAAINIPEGVANIGNSTFENCSNLTTINIPKGVTSIGYSAFSGCSNLTSITIPEGVTSIGSSAFRNCSSLTSIIIPEAVTNIEKWTFSGCNNLITIRIPKGVTSIGEYVFNACYNLKNVYCYAETVPTTNATAFVSLGYGTLYVPTNAIEDYKSTVPWSSFGTIVSLTDEKVTSITLSQAAATLTEGDELTLNAIVAPDYATDPSVVWSSNNPDVATVDDKGVITAIAPGEATITATANDGSGVSASCDVTVKARLTFIVITDPYTEDVFVQDEYQENMNITYTRTFNNTNWQALYVPFDIPVTEDFLADFEVADLNDVRQYDRDNDGVKDETVIEAFKVANGTLAANYPYLMRAREAGEKTITVTDATLYAAEENSIDCSSVREKFTFTGTYSQLSSEELPQGEGYYALSGGVWQPVAEGTSLGAFRFYLKVDSRGGVSATQGNAIRMRVIGGSGEEDGTTGIDHAEFKNQNSELIYDLQGRRVENPTKGVYIVNGVKRVF